VLESANLFVLLVSRRPRDSALVSRLRGAVPPFCLVDQYLLNDCRLTRFSRWQILQNIRSITCEGGSYAIQENKEEERSSWRDSRSHTATFTPEEYLALDNSPATNRMPKELALTTRRVTIHAPGKDFEAKVIKSREAPGTWELTCNPCFEHSGAQLTEESRFQLLP